MCTLWILFEIGINIFEAWLYSFFLHRRLNQKPELSAKKAAFANAVMIIGVACFYSLYIWFDIPVTDSVVWIFTTVYSFMVFSDKKSVILAWNISEAARCSGHHALTDFENRHHNVHAVGHRRLCQYESEKEAHGLFGALQLRQVHGGLHDAHHEEQHQQRKPHGDEGIVDALDHIPDRAALESLGRLGNQLPDLRHLLIPCVQRIDDVVHDPRAWMPEWKTICRTPRRTRTAPPSRRQRAYSS